MQLADRIEKGIWKSLSIVGTAKNAGKTTVLNHVYRHLHRGQQVMGLMSTGRDGEAVDLVTNEPKPQVWAEESTLLATAQGALALGGAFVEVIETLPLPTLHGPVTISRVREAGPVELVGPAHAVAVRHALDALHRHGAERVLVDGSMDRRSAASPHVTGNVILVSGAALSTQLAVTVQRTALWVELMGLPPVEDEHLRQQLRAAMPGAAVSIVDQHGRLRALRLDTALTQGATIARSLAAQEGGVVLGGALTDDLLKALMTLNRPLLLVINDATRAFVSAGVYRRFMQSGGRVRVVHPIQLLALCVNPVAPYGQRYDAERFIEEMAAAVPGVPVFDVALGLYREEG